MQSTTALLYNIYLNLAHNVLFLVTEVIDKGVVALNYIILRCIFCPSCLYIYEGQNIRSTLTPLTMTLMLKQLINTSMTVSIN